MTRREKREQEHERRQDERRRAGRWGTAGQWGMRCAHCGHGMHDGQCRNCKCQDFDF
jgi:hypothetical protein